jgi:hypothetical protein
MRGLTPDQVRKLHDMIHAKQLINAVQFYQQATGVSLGEAREAIKIYSEEYGVGLNEAQTVVERIEASMLAGGSSVGMSYESAIGADPFAEDNSINKRTVVLFAVALMLAMCGAGVFFLLLGF